AAVAGLAGGLSVQLQAVADPVSYDPFLSFKLLVAVLLGGAAATLGPAFGGQGVLPWALRRLPRQSHSRRRPATPPSGAPGPNDPVLSATGLRKAYGGVIAVDDFSLELRRGETAALIGPNGSGKTTALRLIAGAEPADAGVVVVDGVEVTIAPTAERVRLGI